MKKKVAIVAGMIMLVALCVFAMNCGSSSTTTSNSGSETTFFPNIDA